MKSTWKRLISLALSMCMVFALLPNISMTAFAATSGTVTGLADENIGLSFTGDADNAWSASGTSIIGAATSTGGTCSDTSHKSTLTITNKKSIKATLSFDYSIEQNSGKFRWMVQRFLRVPGLPRNWRQTRALKYTSSLAAPVLLRRSPLPTWFW